MEDKRRGANRTRGIDEVEGGIEKRAQWDEPVYGNSMRWRRSREVGEIEM